VLAQRSARFFGVHFKRRLVARPAARDQHVVDRHWQLLEESLQRSRIARAKSGGAPGAKLEPSLLQALAVARREDDLSALGPSVSGGLQTNPGAPADHDDCLPEKSWLTHGRMVRTRRLPDPSLAPQDQRPALATASGPNVSSFDATASYDTSVRIVGW
jgi:hypothetical protein